MIIIIGGGGIAKKIAKELGATIIPHSLLDVIDRGAVSKFVEEFVKEGDIIINCAGIYGPIGKFHKNELSKWHETIAVNLLGTVNVCHAVLRKIKKGSIINMAGGGATYPRPQFSAYATSKAGILRFTETIAQEYPLMQINCLAPGFFRTKMTKNVEKRRKDDNVNKVIKAINFIRENKTLTGKIIYAQDL